MATNDFPLAVTELFKAKTRRELLRFLFGDTCELPFPGEEGYDNTWYTKKEFVDATEMSGESVRVHLDALQNFGILELKSEDAQIPHYRIADTDVIELLRSTDNGVELLCDLFEFSARQGMVAFFLDRADSEQSYSMNQIHKQGNVGRNAVSNHIDVLVEAEIVEPVEGKRGTEYQRTESDTIEFLETLNNVLAAQYQG